MRTVSTLALATIAALGISITIGEEVYRRATLTETSSGVVEIRRAYSALVDLPARCQEGEMACRETKRVPLLFRIEFREESALSVEDGLRVSSEPRGVLYVALQVEEAEQQIYDELLVESLRALAADSFRMEFAGLSLRERPFDGVSLVPRSAGPNWQCRERSEGAFEVRYERTEERHPDGRVGHRSSTMSESRDTFEESFCSSAEAAIGDAAPEVVRTMPAPLSMREQRIDVRVLDSLASVMDPEDLLVLPEEIQVRRELVPKSEGRAANSTGVGDCIVYAETTSAGERLIANVESAWLDPGLTDGSVWISAWTLSRSEMHLGLQPTTREEMGASLLLAAVPTARIPTTDERGNSVPAAGGVRTLELDGKALIERVGVRFERSAELSLDSVVGIAQRHSSLWMARPDWLLIACRDEGKAEFLVPGTDARCGVENGSELCDALWRRLD